MEFVQDSFLQTVPLRISALSFWRALYRTSVVVQRLSVSILTPVGKVNRNDPLHLTLSLAPINHHLQQAATHHHRKRLRRPSCSALFAARALLTSRRNLRHQSAGWNCKREGSARVQMTQRRRTGSRSLEWPQTWHSCSATGLAAMPPGRWSLGSLSVAKAEIDVGPQSAPRSPAFFQLAAASEQQCASDQCCAQLSLIVSYHYKASHCLVSRFRTFSMSLGSLSQMQDIVLHRTSTQRIYQSSGSVLYGEDEQSGRAEYERLFFGPLFFVLCLTEIIVTLPHIVGVSDRV